MAQIKTHKYVAALPPVLEADAIYFVRAGDGFDLYVTNHSGTIVAYPLNQSSGGGGTAITGFIVPFTGTGSPQNITIPTASSAADILVFFGPARQLSSSYSISGTTLTVTAPSGVSCEVVKLPGVKGDTGDPGANGTNGTVDTIGEYGNAANPTLPSSGLRIFARKNAGRNRLAYIGPSGIDVSVQAFLGANKVGYWGATGNSNAAFNSATPGLMLFNFGHVASGTATARSVATTNLFTSTRRMGFVSSATAGNAAGTRSNLAQFWTGNAPGLGGFEYITRFGLSQVNATTRFFAGLSPAAALTNANISTMSGIVGIARETNETTFSITTGSGGTKIPLGANFPCNTQNVDLYELRLFCAPNSTTINWSVSRLNTGHYIEGTIAANLPATQLYGTQIWINNGTTASAVAVDVISQYIETDT